MKRNITIFLLLLMIAIFLVTPNFMDGYQEIITSTSILATDYIGIAGFNVTFFNVLSTVVLAFLFLMTKKLYVNGSALAGILTIAGFSFFGKNVLNMLPLLIGGSLYVFITKKDFQEQAGKILFTSGIAPVTSFIMFGINLEYEIAIPLAFIVGIIVGYLSVWLGQYTKHITKDYNLYSMGFTLGVVSMAIYGVFLLLKIEVTRDLASDLTRDVELLVFLLGLSLFFILISVWVNRDVFRHWINLLGSEGHASHDYIKSHGYMTTLFNVGVMGLLSFVILIVFNLSVSGPVIGAILTLLGFSAVGNHVLNSLPILAGALIGYYFGPNGQGVSMIAGIFFSTAIAPIAGKFGVFYGILAGFLHMLVLPYALKIQGGFDLYNNGFAAGIVVLILMPILYFFKKNNNRAQVVVNEIKSRE